MRVTLLLAFLLYQLVGFTRVRVSLIIKVTVALTMVVWSFIAVQNFTAYTARLLLMVNYCILHISIVHLCHFTVYMSFK